LWVPDTNSDQARLQSLYSPAVELLLADTCQLLVKKQSIHFTFTQ
jgi:hypothetical protein